MTVLPGSDVCGLLLYPGFSLHDELALFVERAGMSLEAAAFLGLGEELGSLEPGKLADFATSARAWRAKPQVDRRGALSSA